jgi:hypothetical protein
MVVFIDGKYPLKKEKNTHQQIIQFFIPVKEQGKANYNGSD